MYVKSYYKTKGNFDWRRFRNTGLMQEATEVQLHPANFNRDLWFTLKSILDPSYQHISMNASQQKQPSSMKGRVNNSRHPTWLRLSDIDFHEWVPDSARCSILVCLRQGHQVLRHALLLITSVQDDRSRDSLWTLETYSIVIWPDYKIRLHWMWKVYDLCVWHVTITLPLIT
jgi:hypothetical protein